MVIDTLALLFKPLTRAPEILPGFEVIQEKDAVLAQGACDFLHRLDAAARGLIAEEIQEDASPGGKIPLPELAGASRGTGAAGGGAAAGVANARINV